MMLVGWSLNEELEGMNYHCQNLHYYLDEEEVALF